MNKVRVVVVIQGGLAQYAVTDSADVEVLVKDIDKNNDPEISFSEAEIVTDAARTDRAFLAAKEQIENGVDPDPESDEDI